MLKRCCEFLVLASLCPLGPAQQAGPSPWVGTWKLDRAASHFVGFVVTIHHLSHSYRFELEGTTIEVGDDGEDYATAPTRTTSFKQLNAHQWMRVHKIAGEVVDTSTFTLSPDAGSFTIHTLAADAEGKTHASDELFRREGTGSGIGKISGSNAGSGTGNGPASGPASGIDGTWRSISAGISVPETFVIAAAPRGGLRFSYPTQELAFVTPLDGSAVPYTGSHAVPSVRVVAKSVSAAQIGRTDLLGGRPYQEATDTLSPNGNQLTEVSWHVATPADKDEAVYRRQ